MRALAFVLFVFLAAVIGSVYAGKPAVREQPKLGHRSATFLAVDGLQFKT